MKKSTITIHVGASHDEVNVDGVVFDRSRMTGPEKRKLSRLVVAGLETQGYFGLAR